MYYSAKIKCEILLQGDERIKFYDFARKLVNSELGIAYALAFSSLIRPTYLPLDQTAT